MARPNSSLFNAWLWMLAILLVTGRAQALEDGEIRHLMDRAGFGPQPADLNRFSGLNRAQAVDLLLREPLGLDPPSPEWVAQGGSDIGRIGGLTRSERAAMQGAFARLVTIPRLQQLRAWWMLRMVQGSNPLQERMALFWHDHFAVKAAKVVDARLLWRYLALLRSNALGSFRDLLRGMAQDPAMLKFLDNHRNTRKQPNENWGRELLELFTLGEGNYSEADVLAVARSFTGWGFDADSGRFRINLWQHDDQEKAFLGRTGHFGGLEIVQILLAQPRTAVFLVEKLWREFVSPDPDAAEVRRIASILRETDYDLRAALRALLLTDAFWAADQRGTLVKSPIELVIGTVHRLALPLSDGRSLDGLSWRIGQRLLSPPNVAGWPGGTAWLDANALTLRNAALDRIWRGLRNSTQEEDPTISKEARDLDGEEDAEDMENRSAATMGQAGEARFMPDLTLFAALDDPSGHARIKALFLPFPEDFSAESRDTSLSALLEQLIHHPDYNLK